MSLRLSFLHIPRSSSHVLASHRTGFVNNLTSAGRVVYRSHIVRNSLVSRQLVWAGSEDTLKVNIPSSWLTIAGRAFAEWGGFEWIFCSCGRSAYFSNLKR